MVAVVAAVTCVAAAVQGAAGFGAALILAPVLALLIDDSKVITTFLVGMGLVINLIILLRVKLKADVKKVLLMTLLSVFGILAGTYTLHRINAAEPRERSPS